MNRCAPLLTRLAVWFFSAGSLLSVPARADIVTAWSKSYGNQPYLTGHALGDNTRLMAAGNGDLVTIGTAAGKNSAWRHTPVGSLVWSAEESGYNATGALDPAGNVCMTGAVKQTGSSNYDIMIKKLSGAGGQMWRTVWSSGLFSSQVPEALVTDSSGNVYVAGSGSGGNEKDLLLVKFDGGGVFQWSRFYDGPAHADDIGAALVLMPDNSVTVCGSTTTPAGDRDFLAIRYSETGERQWVQTWDFGSGGDDTAHRAVVDAAGNVTLGGESVVSGEVSYVAALRLSSAGNPVWQNRFLYVRPGWYMDSPGRYLNRLRDMALNASGELGMSMGSYNSGTRENMSEFGSLAVLSAGGVVLRQSELSYSYHGYSGSPPLVMGAGAIAWQPDGGCLISADKLTRLKPDGTVDWQASPTADSWLVHGHYSRAMLLHPNGAFYEALAVSETNGSGAVTVRKWGPAYDPDPPVLQTGAATEIAMNSATVGGTVNRGQHQTTWWFEYGQTTAYGSASTPQTLTPGSGPVSVTAALTGLTPGTAWHFRLVASNGTATTRGDDQTFTTAPTVVQSTPWQAWVTQKFGAANAPGSAPGDDPDKDGFTNLTEFAFGGEPLQAGAPPGLPVPERYTLPASGISYLAITYTVNPAATGLLYTPEAGLDPSSPFSTFMVTIEDLGNNRRRAIAFSGGQFMRVRLLLTQ